MINIRKYIKERESQDKNSFEKKLWFHRGKKLAMAVGFLVAVVAILSAYQYYSRHLVYTGYDVLSVSELTVWRLYSPL